MASQHPSSETLRAFAARRLPARRARRALWHLSRCDECQERLVALPGGAEVLSENLAIPAADDEAAPATPAPAAPDYEAAISRTYAALLASQSNLEHERVSAPQLLAELERHPIERQRVLIHNARRFHSWPLAELMLKRVSQVWSEDPTRAQELAELTLEVADHLSGPPPHRPLHHDLKARVYAYLANTRRLRSDLAGAERIFAVARHHLVEGSGDVLERALYYEMLAALRIDQRRLDEADEVLRGAVSIYRQVRDPNLAGRAMLNQANVRINAGRLEEAVTVLRQAVRHLDPQREPRHHIGAYHNLIVCLVEAERYMEAEALIAKSRPLYQRHGDVGMHRRLRWVRGQIAAGLGELEKAETIFDEVRRAYLEQEIPYDAALVSLDLAMVYARQGRTAELKELAAEMVSTFEALDIRREALAALMLLQRATEAERATRALIERLARRVKKSAGR